MMRAMLRLGRLATPAPGSPWRAPVVRFVLAIELVVALLVAGGLWLARERTLKVETRVVEVLARTEADRLDGLLQTAELATDATLIELAAGVLEPGRLEAHQLLRSRASALPAAQALVIYDREGRVVASSSEHPPTAAHAAERDFFRVHRESRAPGLYISQPFADEREGLATLAMTAAWRSPDGELRGVVGVMSRTAAFVAPFAALGAGPDARLALLRADGSPVLGAGAGAPNASTAPAGRGRPAAASAAPGGLPTVSPASASPSAEPGSGSGSAGSVGSVGSVGSPKSSGTPGSHEDPAGRLDAASRAPATSAWQEGVGGPAAMSAAPEPTRGVAASSSSAGSFHAPIADGPGTLQARQALAHYPFQVVVSRETGPVLETWAAEATVVGTFAAAMLAAILAVTLRFARESDRRRLSEARLAEHVQRSSRMESLGTLAGGIAHDFNNVLAAVIGFGEMARQAAPPQSGQARQLDQVLQAGQRGKALIERILAFSRRSSGPRRAFEVQPMVGEVLELLAASTRTGITLETALEAPDATVLGDETLLYEAVLNLCTNALQAMPGGGRLQVALAERRVERPQELSHGAVEPGRYLRLAVTDSGPGIDAATLERIFDPFFTTKAAQQGTGLGLSVVHGVVRELGGAIDVRTAPGRGSTFALWLPCAAPPPSPAARESGAAHGAEDALPRGHGQTVLVVDDEPALVELAEDLLAELGYEPVGFRSGPKALAEFERTPERFDLVLTDQVMPELSGLQLAAAVRARAPDVPIVLASGWGGAQLAERAVEAGVTLVVAKPLGRAELAQVLARALRIR